MNQELIQSLSVITEEEQKILAGSADIDRTLYMDREDMVIDSDKLLEAGQLITIRPHTRFVHFPEHTHNYVEVIYMCRGETIHVVDGRELKLKEGELLFLNQHAVQEIQPAGQDDIAVNFIILPEFFDTAFRMIGRRRTCCGILLWDASATIPGTDVIFISRLRMCCRSRTWWKTWCGPLCMSGKECRP